MKHVAWCCILILALTLIWQPAVEAVLGVVDLGLAARSLVAGFLLGLLLAWVLAYSAIWNRIVEADRRRDLDKVNDQHDKRRI